MENKFASESNEIAVLKCALLDEEYFSTVMELLTEDYFYASDCRSLFLLLNELFIKYNKVTEQHILAEGDAKQKEFYTKLMEKSISADCFEDYLSK